MDEWLCFCHLNMVASHIQLEFERGSDEGRRRLMARGFECTQMLLDRVVKATKFLSRSILKTGCLEDCADVGLVD